MIVTLWCLCLWTSYSSKGLLLGASASSRDVGILPDDPPFLWLVDFSLTDYKLFGRFSHVFQGCIISFSGMRSQQFVSYTSRCLSKFFWTAKCCIHRCNGTKVSTQQIFSLSRVTFPDSAVQGIQLISLFVPWVAVARFEARHSAKS